MKGFYIRWSTILLAGVIIAILGLWRYEREVTVLSPGELLREQPTQTVRILGTVQPGTLVREVPSGGARFQLSGNGNQFPVRFTGTEEENLRELKTLVVVGRWDPVSREFQADKIAIVPNYGFIVAAYLVGIVPLVMFLFGMERKVRLLYREIKGTDVYEPEKVFDIG